MTTEFRMPSLGAGMSEGVVLEWHVRPGDRVRRGNVIGVVDTDKGAIDVGVWEDGEVVEVLAPPGTKAPVGEPLLALRAPEDADRAFQVADRSGPEKVAPEEVAPEEAAPEVPRAPAETAPPRAARVRASPVARRRAQELRVDLSEVEGTGPDGALTLPDLEEAASRTIPRKKRALPERGPRPRDGIRATPVARKAAEVLGVDLARVRGSGPRGTVTREDVEMAARGNGQGKRPETRAEGERSPADRQAAIRRAVAQAMARSKREIPHYYMATTLSMEAALDWLETTNTALSPKDRILPVTLHLKAIALTLADYPELNGFWEDGAFRPAAEVHAGLAVSLRGGGLVAPAIHRVAERGLGELTFAVRDVVQRARTGGLRASEMSDATVTVTSLGDRGVETVFGVIHPPQVAIIGIGTTVERPWAHQGMVGARRITTLTLSADHRASDGHRGGLFLADVARRLQSPEEL